MDFKPAIRFPLLGTGILLRIALGWAVWGIIREVWLMSRLA